MDKVTIVILNWNGCEMPRSFLPSVVRCSETEGMEIYVAGSGSTDTSTEMLRQGFLSVHLIILDKNRDFAEGYNLALQQMSAKYVALLNSDVEVTGCWLAPLVSYMDAHPEATACQPKIRNWRHKERFEYAGAAGGFTDRYDYPFYHGWIMGVVEEDDGQYDTVIPVFWATGVALFIRLKDYQDTGGLGGRFLTHMEEIDLCWRLRAHGRILACVLQSTVYHVGDVTLKKENPYKTFLNFRNNLVVLYKNLPEEELGCVIRTRAVFDCMAALSFLLKGQFVNMWAVLRARRAFHSFHPLLAADREGDLKKTSLPAIPERTESSILVQFYLHGKKFFSRL